MKKKIITKLIQHFSKTTEKTFSYLVKSYGFIQRFGIYDSYGEPPSLVAINYENIPDYFSVSREFSKEDIIFTFTYSTKGQFVGRGGIDIYGDYSKGEYGARTGEIINEAGFGKFEMSGLNIESEEAIDTYLSLLNYHIKNNIDFFINPNLKVFKTIRKKQLKRQSEALKKLGYS